jgi:hypothetical protein
MEPLGRGYIEIVKRFAHKKQIISEVIFSNVNPSCFIYIEQRLALLPQNLVLLTVTVYHERADTFSEVSGSGFLDCRDTWCIYTMNDGIFMYSQGYIQ